MKALNKVLNNSFTVSLTKKASGYVLEWTNSNGEFETHGKDLSELNSKIKSNKVKGILY